jgi:hypothetical protein
VFVSHILNYAISIFEIVEKSNAVLCQKIEKNLRQYLYFFADCFSNIRLPPKSSAALKIDRLPSQQGVVYLA